MLPYINKVNLLIINQLAPLHHVSFVLFFHNFLISSLSFLPSSFLLFSFFLPLPFLSFSFPSPSSLSFPSSFPDLSVFSSSAVSAAAAPAAFVCVLSTYI